MFIGYVQLGGTLASMILFRDAARAPVNTDSDPTFRVYGPDGLVALATGASAFLDTGAVTDATNATPVVVTSANHGLTTGQKVYVQGGTGNTVLNNAQWTVTVTDANTFTCPATGNGDFYVAPGTQLGRWCLAPDSTTTYAIIKSEVQLTAADANTVQCGIDIRDFKTLAASASDTGIAFAVHDQTGNPNLVGTNGPLATTYETTAGGAGIGNGVSDNAPALDYFGITRSGNPDIGFYQTPSSTVTVTLTISNSGGLTGPTTWSYVASS